METLLAEDLVTQQAERWRSADKLVTPLPSLFTDRETPQLVARDGAGRMVGAGLIRREVLQPGDPRLTYIAADQHQLLAYVGGDDPAGALDQLIGQWRTAIAELDDVGEESAAVVMWPSRDTVVQTAMVRHGLAPLTVLGVRTPGAPTTPDPVRLPDVHVRLATPDDADAVLRLRLQEITYATQFGQAIVRSHTEQGLREEIARDLAAVDVWTWVAERDGEIVGAHAVAPSPQETGWIAWLVNAHPAVYGRSLSVAPGVRGSGVGSVLAAAAYERLDEAGITLLGFYSPANPLSVPFWNRLGVRPLWTFWETRPVTSLR